MRRSSRSVARAASAAALEAEEAGLDEDDVREAAEAAAHAAEQREAEKAHRFAATGVKTSVGAALVLEVWPMLFDGALVAVMITAAIMMARYSVLSETALSAASGR